MEARIYWAPAKEQFVFPDLKSEAKTLLAELFDEKRQTRQFARSLVAASQYSPQDPVQVGWYLFLSFDQGVPVSLAECVVLAKSEFATSVLTSLVTLPNKRGRGMATYLVGQSIEHLRSSWFLKTAVNSHPPVASLHATVSEGTPKAGRILRRLGFSQVSSGPNHGRYQYNFDDLEEKRD